MRTFHTGVLISALVALGLAACSLSVPARPTAVQLPLPTRTSSPLALQPATRTPPPTLLAPTTNLPTPTRPAPTPTLIVPQTLEQRDLAVLSPANITRVQLLAAFRPGPNGAVAPLLFSPDHNRLIFSLASAGPQGGAPVYIWSLSAGLPDHILQSGSPAQPVLALSTDASMLASAGTRALTVWTTRDWQPLPALPESFSPAAALAFDPSGSLLAGSISGQLHAWDAGSSAESWSVLAHENGLTALAAGHTGAWAATAGLDGALRLWKSPGGEKERDLSASAGAITSLAFTTDDQQLISYAKDGQMRFWQLSDGKPAGQFQACSSGLPGCTPPAFAPDRRMVALSDPAAEDGPGLRIWDLQTRSLLFVAATAPLIDSAQIAAQAFSPDGRLLAVGSQDGLIEIWGIPGTPFALDAQLRVTESGDGANLRDRPALEGSIRSQLRAGETLSLREGPLVAGGYNWWRALTEDGRDGWIVEVPEWYEAGGS